MKLTIFQRTPSTCAQSDAMRSRLNSNSFGWRSFGDIQSFSFLECRRKGINCSAGPPKLITEKLQQFIASLRLPKGFFNFFPQACGSQRTRILHFRQHSLCFQRVGTEAFWVLSNLSGCKCFKKRRTWLRNSIEALSIYFVLYRRALRSAQRI